MGLNSMAGLMGEFVRTRLEARADAPDAPNQSSHDLLIEWGYTQWQACWGVL